VQRHVDRATASWIIALIGVLGFGTTALGHALQPGYLEIRLIDQDLYAVLWKVPAVNAGPMPISAELPRHCDPQMPDQATWDGRAYTYRWTARCTGGLEGGIIHVKGLAETTTDVLIRLDRADGENLTHRLSARDPSFTIPETPSRLDVVQTYSMLGIVHILGGLDHLAFVLALLLIVKERRGAIATITAFTIAHSITLAGATLGFVHVPGPPVEAMIALSIVFVAAEIIHARQGKSGVTERYPWMIAFTFGLLHGFGFAGALSEVGLPSSSIPIALLFFNVGVEIGQLAFIAGVFAVVAIADRIAQHIDCLRPGRPWRIWASGVPPYTIGTLSAFWFLERVASF